MASTTSTSTSFHSLSSTFTPNRNRHSFSQAPPSSVSFQRRVPSITASYTTTPTNLALAPATSSFYEVLGIQNGATCQEIKSAYRKLARVLHPDAALSKGQKDATSSADEFIRVHQAYATLSDPRKRADYDRKLFFERRRVRYTPNYAVSTGKYQTTSSSGFSGYTRRTWETDQCW